MVEAPRIIDDPVYGPTEITEPVLIELMNSPTMVRLGDISQLGPPKEFHHLNTYSRLEHSIGVAILLQRLAAPLEEQVSGELHDVSHSAFSHVRDWLEGTQKNDNFQDNAHENHLVSSDVPEILSAHGFDIRRIIDYHNFPLLEQVAPRLCADRVDYTLREWVLNNHTPNIAPYCLRRLTVADGRMVFSELQAAHYFGWASLRLLRDNWGNREAVGRYMIFVNILRDARNQGVIETVDFDQKDAFVIAKLKQAPKLAQRLEDLKRPFEEIPDFQKIKGQTGKYKFRYVDPEFLDGGALVKLSSIDSTYARNLRQEADRAKLGIKF